VHVRVMTLNYTDVTPLKRVIDTDDLLVEVDVIGRCRAFLGTRVNLGEARS
jgi:hypothetical protein